MIQQQATVTAAILVFVTTTNLTAEQLSVLKEYHTAYRDSSCSNSYLLYQNIVRSQYSEIG